MVLMEDALMGGTYSNEYHVLAYQKVSRRNREKDF